MHDFDSEGRNFFHVFYQGLTLTLTLILTLWCNLTMTTIFPSAQPSGSDVMIERWMGQQKIQQKVTAVGFSFPAVSLDHFKTVTTVINLDLNQVVIIVTMTAEGH